MKKSFFVVLTFIALLVLSACGGAVEKTYYFAAETPNQNSDWVYWVEVVKEGDKIVDAKWDAYNVAGDTNKTLLGISKYEASKTGKYKLGTPSGDADPRLEWFAQADKVVAQLISSNNVNERIPASAGVSISTSEFYSLVELALSKPAVEKGEFVNGYHFASTIANAKENAAKKFWDPVAEEIVEVAAYNYYNFGSFVVVNGTIVLAYYNSAFNQYRLKMDESNKVARQLVDHDNDPETDDLNLQVIEEYTTASPKLYNTKNQLGYSYAMKKPNGPGNFEYFEAAKAAGDYLVANQKFPALNDKNGFDDVAGVTVTADYYVTLFNAIPKK